MKPSRAIELLERLRTLDVKLEPRGDKLRVSAAEGVLSRQLRDEITRHKKDLLELLGEEHTAVPLLVHGERDAVLPLSFAQKRLWILHTLGSGGAYNISLALALGGTLSNQALARALSAIGERHETLRTTFALVDGEPTQRIGPVTELDLPLVDLAAEGLTDVEAAAREHARAFLATPFDLEQGPVWRAQLLRLAPTRHWLLISVHHIASDGWSMGVLQRELAAFYQAFRAQEPSPLSALSVQYADFAVWQRERLSGERLDQQLAYWHDQLADAPTLHGLPLDHPRPAEQRFVGKHLAFSLDAALTAGLRRLSRAHGATLFMTLLAGFTALLARHAGQTDWVIGTPVANRVHPDLEPLIGFFVNTLALRVRWEDDPPWSVLLAQVREMALQAYAHQELPFERLVEALNPDRSLSHEPLVQIVFALQNTPAPDWALEGLEVTRVGLPSQATRFELECYLREVGDHLAGVWVFNADVFEASTIERLQGNFETFLKAIVADPAQPVSRLQLLSEGERRHLLVDWNATQTDYPRETCIHDLFEAQVEKTPFAVALVFEDQQLTYGELNDRADHLARYLQQHYGVGPEVRVGLYLQRSVEMIVGVLGIIKAGGAYVPLDPNAPPKRLAFILEDAGAALVLTQEATRGELPAEWSGPVVALDSEWPMIEQTPAATELTSGATAESLAYIMYTSGSTGLPKGTSICQRSVMRLVMNTNYLEFGPTETFLQLAPLAFDASTLELWGSLLHGARLVIFPPHQPSLEELGHCIQEQEISTLWLTAALFHQMVDSQLKALLGVRQLLAGGDVLSVPHVQRLVANLPEGGRLINGYGPTENTTFTCCHVMTRESPVETTVPIGRPIANTQVYVLDRTLQPVPVGVYGELYIGGDGLARNYLQRPTLTAERFVPHPFSAEPGARLYKTGDVVRYRADGTLEFLGRVDHQVQIRGYRVELGEIETVLSQHPGVAESVALGREDVPGDKRLVAYIVPTKAPLSVSDLRQHVKQRVPDYMLPAHFVMVDALPLTPTGKVDRQALPDPDVSRTDLIEEFVPPRNPEEATLAQIWKDLLGVERVGVHDNFFELGGHSLLATQVVSRVYQTFEVEVPFRVFFEKPTVAGLTEVLESYETVPGRSSAIAQILEKIGAMDAEEIRNLLHEKKKRAGL